MPNPTSYISLTGDYGYADEAHEYTTFGNPLETYDQPMMLIRMFVPPGTESVDFTILVYGNPISTARYKIPPAEEGFPDNYYYTLSELYLYDCSNVGIDEGVLCICRDSILGGLEISDAGWLYVSLPFAFSLVEGESGFNQQFSTKVNSKLYNEWYRTYIGDDPGAWDKYVESVMTYIPPTIIPEPDVNDGYYSIHEFEGGLKDNWLPGSAEYYTTNARVDYYQESNLVKMFIPPGTKSIQLSILFTFNATYIDEASYCSVCYGSLPDEAINFGSPSPVELWQIEDGMSGYVTQSGGYIIVISGGGEFDTITNGKWLYVRVSSRPDSYNNTVMSVSGSVVIDQTLYSEWYFSTMWDSEGNPLSTSTSPVLGEETYYDPLLDDGAVYPPEWPNPYPWDQLYPYPFS